MITSGHVMRGARGFSQLQVARTGLDDYKKVATGAEAYVNRDAVIKWPGKRERITTGHVLRGASMLLCDNQEACLRKSGFYCKIFSKPNIKYYYYMSSSRIPAPASIILCCRGRGVYDGGHKANRNRGTNWGAIQKRWENDEKRAGSGHWEVELLNEMKAAGAGDLAQIQTLVVGSRRKRTIK